MRAVTDYAITADLFHLVNGKLSGALFLKVYKAVAFGLVRRVCGHLARKNGPEGTEGVMQSFVVNLLV